MSLDFSLSETINKVSNDSIRMVLFSKIKTGNVIFDTIVTTFILTIMSYSVKLLYEFSYDKSFKIHEIDIKEYVKNCFYKKNKIIMTGKKCSAINYYCTPVISAVFGDRIKAVWEEIISNIENNNTIYEIKDFIALTNSAKDDSKNGNDVFIVSQKKPFLFNKEYKIYATITISSEETTTEKEKGSSKIDTIEVVLYSYETSLSDMKKYIDNITEKYLENIEKSRNNQRFIYKLIRTKYEDLKFECWKESNFDTTRSFTNMFFEQKSAVLEKIDFFLNNRDWYYNKGIPYTIGFGLHGPPGTGKTSFIKSLAKYTNRHIVILSLKLLKTRRQLEDFFYEDRYNENNKKKTIGFDKKIIVIEDIDAQGEIVLDRSKRKNIPTFNFDTITEKTSVGDVIKTMIESEKTNDSKMISAAMKPMDDEPITLDDILNLWDGIEETSGRMLVISSNHYNDLDPAITRPGRIDISIEMNNVSHSIISDMFSHLYEKQIDEALLAKIEPYFYSPAEIINLFLIHKNDDNAFMERLLLNKKVV